MPYLFAVRVPVRPGAGGETRPDGRRRRRCVADAPQIEPLRGK